MIHSAVIKYDHVPDTVQFLKSQNGKYKLKLVLWVLIRYCVEINVLLHSIILYATFNGQLGMNL